MPDLNLQEEEGMQEGGEGMAEGEESATATEEGGGKGGMVKIIVIVVGVLILGGGGVFLLNKLGIIKLWGKKAAPQVVQLQEEAPAENYPEPGTQPATEQAQAKDTSQPQMIETPALDEPKKKMPVSTAAPKLGEMKGEYTIQVSAWREKEVAQEMVKRLGEAGYPAFLEERPYKDGAWYTVRVGRYASRKEAQMAVESFAEELKSRYWIDRIKK